MPLTLHSDWWKRITRELAEWRVSNFYNRQKKNKWNQRQSLDAWSHVVRHVAQWISDPQEASKILLKGQERWKLYE